MSKICRFVPKLTMNGQFMRDFMAEESPCFALGLVEERKQACGFLALRPAEVIPPEISGLGFNFGHDLLGTTEFEVIQFVFHFYGDHRQRRMAVVVGLGRDSAMVAA